jgi:hypothetical protein
MMSIALRLADARGLRASPAGPLAPSCKGAGVIRPADQHGPVDPIVRDDRTPSGIQGVPVMGTFVIRNGKITRWHDYWDTALPMKMITGEDVTALIPTVY